MPQIIDEETAKSAETGQSLGVFVCGPDSMQNDVRNSVAKANLGILGGSKSGGVLSSSGALLVGIRALPPTQLLVTSFRQ